MKIALCLRGKVGNSNKYAVGEKSMQAANIGLKHWKENFLDLNDVDVFMHCWDSEYKEELIRMYSPKGYLFQDQVDFGYDRLTTRQFAIKSNWYSCKRVIDVMRAYEKKHKMKYDAIVLSRYDLALQRPVVVENESLDLSRFYHNGADPIHKYNKEICGISCCNRNSNNYEVGDLFFISNSDNMHAFTRIYDYLGDLGSDSNHKIAARYLRQLDLFDSVGNFLIQKKYDSFYRSSEDGDVPLVRWAYDLNGESK